MSNSLKNASSLAIKVHILNQELNVVLKIASYVVYFYYNKKKTVYKSLFCIQIILKNKNQISKYDF